MPTNILSSMFEPDIVKSLESAGIIRLGSLLRRERLQLKSMGISVEQIQRIEERLNQDDLILKEDYFDTCFSKSDTLRAITSQSTDAIIGKIDSDELDRLDEVLRREIMDEWIRSWEKTKREIPEIRPSDWLTIIRRMIVELIRPELFKDKTNRDNVKLSILKMIANTLQQA